MCGKDIIYFFNNTRVTLNESMMMINDDMDLVYTCVLLININHFFNLRFFFLRSFRQRVVMNKKEKIYSEAGGHTFFVPVEEGFKVIF